MTDSNLNNNSLLNNEEEENTDTINQNNQVVETDNQQTVNNFAMSDENQNIGFQNKNIFTKNIFKSDLSFIDFNTEFNLNNSINSFYMNEGDTFEFASDEYNLGRKLFSQLTNEDKSDVNDNEKFIQISDPLLKYLGFVNFFDKYKNDNTPIRTFKDRRIINKLFKESTGYQFQELLNNDIPLDVIESDEFQTGVDKVIDYYERNGYSITIPERTNLTPFEQTLKGLGLEIGGGLSLDVATAKLLGMGPYGIFAYVLINTTGGVILNYEAQEKRFGQAGFLGRKGELNYGELINSGILQSIPFGVEAKGWKGILKSFGYGGTIGAYDVITRSLVDEKRFPTFNEFLTSVGLGGSFAASLKSGMELFSSLATKFKGKSAEEINAALSDTEKVELKQFFENGLVLQKQLQQQPQAGNTDGFDETIEAVTIMIDNVTKRNTDANGVLKFKNKDEELLFSDLVDQRRKLMKAKELSSQIDSKNEKKVKVDNQSLEDASKKVKDSSLEDTSKIDKTTKANTSESGVGEKKVRVYKMPPNFKNSKGRYGQAPVVFESDFDKMAWSLRFGKKVKAQRDSEILASFINQGFTEKEIREHGAKIHQIIKNQVIDLTGTAQAGNNTAGLTIKVKAQNQILSGKTKPNNTTKNNFVIDEDTGVIKGDGTFVLGGRVKASDRGNTGIITGFNESTGEISVLFTNKKTGATLTKKFKPEQLTPIGRRGRPKKQPVIDTEGETIKSTKNGNEVVEPLETKVNNRNKNPQQIKFLESLKPNQRTMIKKIVAVLQDGNIFKGSKSQVQTKLEGLGMFDEGILDLANTKQIKEYALMYSKLYDLVPSDSLNYALAQTITLASDNVALVNKKFMKAIKDKDINAIRKSINELSDALLEVEEWLTLGIPLRTQAARTVASFNMKPESGLIGKTVDEVINMTPNQKKEWEMIQPDLEKSISEKIQINSAFRADLNLAANLAEETGDYSRLAKLATQIDGTDGQVEKVVAMTQADKFNLGKKVNNVMRTYNEIGINALLSAPTTQEINLFSGIAMSYLKAANLAAGSSNLPELQAAMKHLFALHGNFNFARKAWKRSWDMEDNFINLGNVKGEVSQRYMISSDSSFFPLVAYDKFGKFIRLPSRLMMANDALIQAPNLIAASTYEAFMEGYGLGKRGDELNQFIKGHVDAIITYILNNSKGDLPDAITERILSRSRNFAKSVTFTQDIRTEDLFGKAANQVNKLAASNPYMRFLFTFTKAPTNIIKEVNRYIPLVNQPWIKTYEDGSTANLNLVNRMVLNEMKNDLLNPDPLVRNNALGQIRISMAVGTMLFAMAMKDHLMPNTGLDDTPQEVVLSGGGPNFFTKEGAAKWKGLIKDGWLPYARGVLKRDEDGEIVYKNGEPVRVWHSYEDLPEPIVGFVRLMVDFAKGSPFVKEKEYQEFTCGWVCAFSRNTFNRSFTSQVDEAMKLFTDLPDIGDDIEPDQDINYKQKAIAEFAGRQIAGRTVPYSSFLKKLWTLPKDILEIVGFSEEEAIQLKESKGDYSKLKWFMKGDIKVRAGDAARTDVEISDPNYNKTSAMMKWLESSLQKMNETAIPIDIGGMVPNQVEHITNDVILLPNKGLMPDLFSLAKQSTSKNHPIYKAYVLIGKTLPEPPEIIRGSKFKFKSDEFVPKKLNSFEYNVLKVFVNTKTLKFFGKDLNINEAMNAYLSGAYLPQHYEFNKSRIEEFGLSSPEGKLAAEEIYQVLYTINNKYITNGIQQYTLEYMGEEEFNARRNAKTKIKENHFEAFTKQLDTMNLGTFDNF